jgi:hypothetical protein
VAGAQADLQGLHHPGVLGVAEAEAVLHHVQHVAIAGVDAGVALLGEQAGDLVVAEVGRHRDRKAHHQARVARRGGAGGQVGEDRRRGVAAHRLAAAAAVQPAARA